MPLVDEAFARLGYDAPWGGTSVRTVRIAPGGSEPVHTLSVGLDRDGHLVLMVFFARLPRGARGAAELPGAEWAVRHRWPQFRFDRKAAAGVSVESRLPVDSARPVTVEQVTSWLDTFVGQAVRIGRGLARAVDWSAGVVERSTRAVAPTSRFHLGRVRYLAWDAQDRLWVATARGITVLAPDPPPSGCHAIVSAWDTAPVHALACDPRTGLVAAGTDEGLDLYDGDFTATRALGTAVCAVAFDPSQGRLATVRGSAAGFAAKGLDYSVALWRPGSLAAAPPDVRLPLHGYPADAVAFGADGALAVATASSLEDGEVLVWDSAGARGRGRTFGHY